MISLCNFFVDKGGVFSKVVPGYQNLHMTSDVLGEWFEGYFTDMSGRQGAKTHIGMRGNLIL
jgi:hypothetical protein